MFGDCPAGGSHDLYLTDEEDGFGERRYYCTKCGWREKPKGDPGRSAKKEVTLWSDCPAGGSHDLELTDEEDGFGERRYYCTKCGWREKPARKTSG